jgi:hypothetical protein
MRFANHEVLNCIETTVSRITTALDNLQDLRNQAPLSCGRGAGGRGQRPGSEVTV